MGKNIKIKRGKDLKLDGQPTNEVYTVTSPTTYAIKPTDFKGLLPKLLVKVGDEVKAGDPLFFNKQHPDVMFTSPVSGEVAEIVRGARRAIMEVKVLADSSNSFKSFDVGNASSLTEDSLKSLLMNSGLWPFIVQRPYGVVANPAVRPKAIHISGFDSAPLAADTAITLKGEEANFATGLAALNKLSDKVHLNVKANTSTYNNVSGAEVNTFSGPHPSGLVGVQIHHIDPINKGDVVWTIKPQHVVFIGKFLSTGKVDLSCKIALAGSEVNKPGYYETTVGACVDKMLDGNVSDDNNRVISGNVLTGTKIADNGYLGFFDTQMTVIPEGDHYELLGWLFPNYAKPTISSSFPIAKFLKKSFKVNTNTHGEHRAYVVTGEYEKVMPMDIMPQQLVKSIMAQDLELMENLGIYEVIEEDMALCEFVCTSKIDVQDIIKSGIELMAEEE